ncbi:MAG: hypothetical protein H6919_02975 [Sphingomonadaceae bacterium]|nr:hypothetical protein [Sphingomonadaceae bacterium]
MSGRFALSANAAARVFDRAHQTLVWLAVLVFVLPEPVARGLVVAAMVAVALAATAVALLAEGAPPPSVYPGN